MLTDNINFLLKYDRPLRNELKAFEENHSIERIETRNGMFTLQVNQEDRKLLLHSKYDPLKEAERLIEQFAENISEYDHVFFYGIGLGYHVDAFLNKYPNLSFTLYEPNPYVFNHYLSVKKIEDLPIKNMKHLFVETSETKAKQFLTVFAENLKENSLLITLPSYERIFNEQFKKFASNFKESVKNKRSSFHVNIAFEKRWTINSIMNFPEVLKTPNILHDVNKEHFKNKPAIIVSAGPSLNEELDNLRYIKENGLAYIFAVGSAINTLIEYDVYPDAVCSYDPSERNKIVFNKMINKNIDSIPLIFGSSIGFETLQTYPGQTKLHMVTSQDTVSPYFLKSVTSNVIEKVNDSPSIAVVTFQLLSKMGCNPIILVGQNLAFKNKQRHAKGIDYSKPVQEQELDLALTVESVTGEKVFTNEGFNRMRLELEKYIQICKDTTVINTTKDGAKIHGTVYTPLKQVINEKLKTCVVNTDWLKTAHSQYIFHHTKEKLIEMEFFLRELNQQTEKLTKLIEHMNVMINSNQNKHLEILYTKFDKEFKRFKNNKAFKVFLAPMVRTQYDLLLRTIRSIRFENDPISKGKKFLKTASIFITECIEVLVAIDSNYQNMKHKLEKIDNISVNNV